MSESKHNQYVLKDRGSAQPLFTREDAAPLAQQSSTGKIVFGSGFTLRDEESPFPLSAALQLNGDCTAMDASALASFAEAELEKHHRISYRSYDVEPDFRVCVLADQSSLLTEFSHTYGGILEIEALLIGSHHEDYGSAEELEIIPSGRGHTLNYTLKSPVNRTLCTYCGLCGRTCPERCISENLYFDFGACTFCTDCEKICPEKAIDLHGIERISLDIPAIIILGQPRLALPEKKRSIFHETQVADYLATLYSCRVDEVIACDHAICHLNGSASAETGCRACLQSCSYGAVKVASNQITIDPFSCTECGACVSVCPTGAMQNRKLTDRSFMEFFRTFELQPDTTVIIGSASDLKQFWWYSTSRSFDNLAFIEVARSESVSLMHLLFLVAHGANRVAVLSQPGSPNENLRAAIAETNLFFDKFFALKAAADICSPEDLSSGLLANKSTGPACKPYKDTGFINRRRKLSSIIEHLVSVSENEIILKAGEVRFFGTLSCDEHRCTQCLACLNSCPIEALSADSGTLTLRWNGGLCIGCRSCVDACPESALSYSGDATLAKDFFDSRVIAQAEPMHCQGCGKVFGTKKSFDRVMAILSRKQQNPPEHLQFCEDCRVLKLLENQ